MKDSTSDRIKKAMDLRNLRQVDLIERTQLGRSAISQYVSGKVTPKQDKVYLLAKALNVSPAWLMGYDVPMEANSIISTKPNDLNKFLQQSQVIFDGETYSLDDEDRELIMKSLEVAFAAAKQANKRKK